MCLASSFRRFQPKNKQEPTVGQILSIMLQIPQKLKTKTHKDFTDARSEVKNRKFKEWNKPPIFLPWGIKAWKRRDKETIAHCSFSGFSPFLSSLPLLPWSFLFLTLSFSKFCLKASCLPQYLFSLKKCFIVTCRQILHGDFKSECWTFKQNWVKYLSCLFL